MDKNILITGGAGFIGFHLNKILQNQYNVSSIDSLNNQHIASVIRSKSIINLSKFDINDGFIDQLKTKPDVVVHLAAETGIAASLQYPEKYLIANIQGTFNVLEQCRKNGIKYLIYASSSSVYSPQQETCMHEQDSSDLQLSFYGTSKKMGEVMIENYCKQYGITAIGLRFFTVYGSWTRPDMAAYKFMMQIENKQPVTLYNDGSIYRDFTHVSDIVIAISYLIKKIQSEDAGLHQIFNLGYGTPISVKHYVDAIAESMKSNVSYQFKKLPDNELAYTHCNNDKLNTYLGFKPTCSLLSGIDEMVNWFKNNKYEK
jgi:UDP-glucuronate 4-epimerase